MDRCSQASQKLAGVYRSQMSESYMFIRNAIYDELVKESASGFNDGWTEAIVWTRLHPDYTISEALEAKASELRNRYPYLKKEEK